MKKNIFQRISVIWIVVMVSALFLSACGEQQPGSNPRRAMIQTEAAQTAWRISPKCASRHRYSGDLNTATHANVDCAADTYTRTKGETRL